jgi:hypothetical protein
MIEDDNCEVNQMEDVESPEKIGEQKSFDSPPKDQSGEPDIQAFM